MGKAVIVGAGFSGATIARVLAENGYQVDVYEKRDAIGGNCYDYKAENGVIVQKYGAHLFHTRYPEVMEFISRFADFFPYKHFVLGSIDGALVPIPFNLTALKTLFPADVADRLRQVLIDEYGYGAKVPIVQLKESGNPEVRRLAEYVYEKVFLHYTEKQWHKKLEELDPSVGARVPVSVTDETGYFTDEFQCMPIGGFTPIFEKILAHPGIRLHLSTDALPMIQVEGERLYFEGKPCDFPLVWTGCLDQLLGYKLGVLPYRSLRFEYKDLPEKQFQCCGVVNYPNEYDYTRIIEFKHFTGQEREGAGTTIAYEYPCDYDLKNTPYYPIPQQKNNELYARYREEAAKCRNLYPAGRLAEYRYYNMDQTIYAALGLAKKILEDNQ